jgi:hypothetical protein
MDVLYDSMPLSITTATTPTRSEDRRTCQTKGEEGLDAKGRVWDKPGWMGHRYPFLCGVCTSSTCGQQ